jgi:uncharacterized protein with PQ loop repeat
MEHPKYQGIAVIAGVCTILAFTHLIRRVYLTKETEHLTYTWIFLVLTAQSLLTLYGILNGAYGIYIPSLILISGISYVLYVKMTYKKTLSVEKELKMKNII